MKPKLIYVIFGIGRGGKIVEKSLISNLGYLTSIFDVQCVYIFNTLGKNTPHFLGESVQIHKESFEKNIKKDFQLSKMYTDVHNDNYRSNYNLLQQFEMTKKGCDVAQNLEHSDFVLFQRDDVIVPNRFFRKLLKFNNLKRFYYTSAYHANNGVCERIGFTTYEDVIIFNKYSYLNDYYTKLPNLNYAIRKGLNAEFLMRYIVESSNLKLFTSYNLIARIREKGIIVNERMPRPYHFSSEINNLKGFIRYLSL
jgi:hypothetical protein